MAIAKIKNGQYVIIEKIGRGGQSMVFKAEDTAVPGKLVALKVIPFLGRELDIICSSEGYQRFHWEYVLTSKLKHPQIATAFDYGIDQENRLAYSARTYLEGFTITDLLIKNGPFELKEALRLILSIAGVLDYIHKHNVIHCDLKPSNVFIEYDEPILIDFGLSSGKAASDFLTGGASGTADYIAPEILDPVLRRKYMNEPVRDWWGLGCVAFNMITGKRLFKTKKTAVLQAQLARGIEQKVIEKLLTGHVAHPLISALMERDPEKRANSKKDLERIIKRYHIE